MPAEIKNVYIYLRKSRAEEITDTTDETLRKHKKHLLAVCRERKYNILDIFQEVVSGESISARPEMQKLLSLVEQNTADGVVCMDFSRLGRGSMKDQGMIIEAFQNSDTVIVTPDKIYDLSNEFDEEMTEFNTFMARKELKWIKRRFRDGKLASLSDGCYMSNPPFGYDKATVNKQSTLKINEKEAEFVRMMFHWYVYDGMGCQTIAYKLNNMGAKPRRSNQFCRTSVMKILKNPVYIGLIVWNQKKHIRKNTKGNDKNIIIYNPPEKWMIKKGIHPPILEEELFQKAQDIIKKKSHPPTNKGIIYNPLSGILYCKNCGFVMLRKAYPKRGLPDEIICQTKGCNKGSTLERVETAVLEYLKNTLNQIRLKEKEKESSDRYENLQNTLSVLENELSSLERQKERLYDLLEQEVYDISTFTKRSAALKSKQEKLLQSKKEIIEEMKKEKSKDLKALASKIENVLNLYHSVSPQEQNELLKTVIKRIDYYKEKSYKPNQFDLFVELSND